MDVIRVLKENNIVPRKEYDQYFIIDNKILEKEAKLAKLSANDRVLEIGAGVGNLTEKLAKKSKVIAIEKDYAFRNILKTVNANVIFGDAVEILESLRKIRQAKGTPPEFNKIVSNLPYSRTQDILIEMLQHQWELAVIIVQKEFAQKLLEKEKIALAVNDCCKMEILDTVGAAAFYPKAVESSIVVLTQKKMLEHDFWIFLGEMFKNRNKDVKNVMKKYKGRLSGKKIHQLKIEELKELHKFSAGK